MMTMAMAVPRISTTIGNDSAAADVVAAAVDTALVSNAPANAIAPADATAIQTTALQGFFAKLFVDHHIDSRTNLVILSDGDTSDLNNKNSNNSKMTMDPCAPPCAIVELVVDRAPAHPKSPSEEASFLGGASYSSFCGTTTSSSACTVASVANSTDFDFDSSFSSFYLDDDDDDDDLKLHAHSSHSYFARSKNNHSNSYYNSSYSPTTPLDPTEAARLLPYCSPPQPQPQPQPGRGRSGRRPSHPSSRWDHDEQPAPQINSSSSTTKHSSASRNEQRRPRRKSLGAPQPPEPLSNEPAAVLVLKQHQHQHQHQQEQEQQEQQRRERDQLASPSCPIRKLSPAVHHHTFVPPSPLQTATPSRVDEQQPTDLPLPPRHPATTVAAPTTTSTTATTTYEEEDMMVIASPTSILKTFSGRLRPPRVPVRMVSPLVQAPQRVSLTTIHKSPTAAASGVHCSSLPATASRSPSKRPPRRSSSSSSFQLLSPAALSQQSYESTSPMSPMTPMSPSATSLTLLAAAAAAGSPSSVTSLSSLTPPAPVTRFLRRVSKTLMGTDGDAEEQAPSLPMRKLSRQQSVTAFATAMIKRRSISMSSIVSGGSSSASASATTSTSVGSHTSSRTSSLVSNNDDNDDADQAYALEDSFPENCESFKPAAKTLPSAQAAAVSPPPPAAPPPAALPHFAPRFPWLTDSGTVSPARALQKRKKSYYPSASEIPALPPAPDLILPDPPCLADTTILEDFLEDDDDEEEEEEENVETFDGVSFAEPVATYAQLPPPPPPPPPPRLEAVAFSQHQQQKPPKSNSVIPARLPRFMTAGRSSTTSQQELSGHSAHF